MTYVCLCISIGLLVDFIVHVLLRYYESTKPTKEEKVIDTLETMGASILVGGISTFLGVIPLAFSTSEIMSSVFICFLSMVVIGVTHGLIFMPVVLSILGPSTGGHMPIHECVERHEKQKYKTNDSDTEESDGSAAGSVNDLHLHVHDDVHNKSVQDTTARNPNELHQDNNNAPLSEEPVDDIHCSFETEKSSRQGHHHHHHRRSNSNDYSHSVSSNSHHVESSEDIDSTYNDHGRRRHHQSSGRSKNADGRDATYHARDPPAPHKGDAEDPPGNSSSSRGEEEDISYSSNGSSMPSQEGFESIISERSNNNSKKNKKKQPLPTPSSSSQQKQRPRNDHHQGRRDQASRLRSSKTIRDESLEVVYRSYTIPGDD